MRKKKKLKKKIIIFLLIVIILAGIGFSFSFFAHKEKVEQLKIELEQKQRESKLNDVKKHYGEKVIVTKDTNLYKLNNDKYDSVGTVYKDFVFNITDKNNELKYDTKYFYIEEYDYYISYKDVDIYNEEIVKDTRYKNYLLFDQNITTKDSVTLYGSDKTTKKLTINNSLDLSIIVKDEEGVFVEYLDNYYFINNSDINNTYDKSNNTSEVASSVPVTVYHFIYLEGDTSCNEIICHSENQIKSNFNYLKENNYFTLNTTELRLFIENKIRLPKNSILITIDDGSRAEKFIPILEEYGINATLFLITSWYSPDGYRSPYLEIASHTHDCHIGNMCPGGQGGRMRCLEHDKLLDDFKTSREILGGTEALCYPFYEYNDYSIGVAKEAGFKMGFMGGMQKVKPGIDLFHIPRITIMHDTSLSEYISLVRP